MPTVQLLFYYIVYNKTTSFSFIDLYFHFSLILYAAINDIKMTQQEDIQKAVEVMRKGGIILYPTDTVWGIGCDATNSEAVAKYIK